MVRAGLLDPEKLITLPQVVFLVPSGYLPSAGSSSQVLFGGHVLPSHKACVVQVEQTQVEANQKAVTPGNSNWLRGGEGNQSECISGPRQQSPENDLVLSHQLNK